VDLTSTWAGPLATRVLADAGADVVRIEPDCRRDNLRDGSPAMFGWLGAGKQTAALDLRQPDDRLDLDRLIAAADVVIDSFSPRVMPNFGLTPDQLDRLRPGIVSVGLPAFPGDVPERDWVGYGTGIHAISGLGDDGAGGFWSPIVPYPDPVAGLTAAVTVLGMLAGDGPRHARVSLLDSIRPLL
jgi:crotonobetainyl-CoA:carnitine CoA-transferase CaiB-like acyl-CoA transferase